MTRPGAHVREAELVQKLSDIARMKVDAEPLADDPLEIDAPPPDDAIFLTVRATLDDLLRTGPVALPTGGAWGPRSSCR